MAEGAVLMIDCPKRNGMSNEDNVADLTILGIDEKEPVRIAIAISAIKIAVKEAVLNPLESSSDSSSCVTLFLLS